MFSFPGKVLPRRGIKGTMPPKELRNRALKSLKWKYCPPRIELVDSAVWFTDSYTEMTHQNIALTWKSGLVSWTSTRFTGLLLLFRLIDLSSHIRCMDYASGRLWWSSTQGVLRTTERSIHEYAYNQATKKHSIKITEGSNISIKSF